MTASPLDPARRRALLDARSAALARRGSVDARAAALAPFLVCACGPDRYGLPLASVARVMPARPCATVPGAPAALLGLVAVSGRVVSVLDLARALGRDCGGEGGGGHFVVLRGGDAAVALAVDRVLGMVSVDPADGREAVSSGFGAEAVSGYAALGFDADGQSGAGFIAIDPPSLLRRFLS